MFVEFSSNLLSDLFILTSGALPLSSSFDIGYIFSSISTPPFLTPIPSLTLTWSTLNLEPPRSSARNCPFSARVVEREGRSLISCFYFKTMADFFFFFLKICPAALIKRDINTSNLSHQEWSGHVSAAFLQLRRPNFQLRAPSSFQPGNELRYQLTGHHGGALHAETCRPERDTEHREQNKVRCTAGFSLEQEGMKERKIYISLSLISFLWTFLLGVRLVLLLSFSYFSFYILCYCYMPHHSFIILHIKIHQNQFEHLINREKV